MIRNCILAAGLAALAAGPAAAVSQTGALPTNAYITLGGLDWAWASPVSHAREPVDFTFQAAFGWRLPTDLELQSAPTIFDFQFKGANVPVGGTDLATGATFDAENPPRTQDAACASPWFSAARLNCDWQDGPGGLLGWTWATSLDTGVEDQLVVRAASQVPAPAALLSAAFTASSTLIAGMPLGTATPYFSNNSFA